jgi:hypothetical protein
MRSGLIDVARKDNFEDVDIDGWMYGIKIDVTETGCEGVSCMGVSIQI